MEGADSLLWLVLLILALLAGCVLYLLITRRNYQRVDYSRLVEQEIERRQLLARLERLEQLISDLGEYDRRRRGELEAFAAETKRELAEQLKRARSELSAEILDKPGRWEQLLLQESGAQPATAGVQPEPAETADAAESPQMRRFLNSPRQQRIAELLELGHTAQEVSQQLSVSRHEVELVAAIIFKTKGG